MLEAMMNKWMGVVAVLCLMSGAGQATVVRVPTFAEMAHRSDLIFEGTVTGQEVVDSGGRIHTLTTFHIDDGLKGTKTNETTVLSQLGGNLNGRGAWIAGAHHFKVGDRVVVFGVHLPKSPGRFVLYGIGFGVFAEQEQGVAELVGDVANATPAADGSMTFSAVQPKRFVSMATFKQEIAAALERPLVPAGKRPATLAR
jgi:hypothetical protein